jgi:hypothetical protein
MKGPHFRVSQFFSLAICFQLLVVVSSAQTDTARERWQGIQLYKEKKYYEAANALRKRLRLIKQMRTRGITSASPLPKILKL